MVEHDAAFQEGAKAAGIRFIRCPCGHGKRYLAYTILTHLSN
jgi:hypothetical protein